MVGVTACLLGDLSARSQLGKVGTQSDIHLHDFKENDRDVTLMIPHRYPEQLKCLSYVVAGAESCILVVSEINAHLGEQILAAAAAEIPHGIIVLQNYLQPEQIKPLLAGTTLADWPIQTEADWPAVKAHIGNTPESAKDGAVLVPIDHHFDVKGVGAVILGVVQQGVLKKGETLVAWPDKVICPVRSIQCHDVDVAEANTGDRVGLAMRNTKAEQLDRGMVLAPADAPLQHLKVGDSIKFSLARTGFSKQPLAEGSVVHMGIGMQFIPIRLDVEAPAAGATATVSATLQKAVVYAPGETGVLWHMDNAPQRVVGRITL